MTQSLLDDDPRLHWFRSARLGMFVHFGLYPSRSWGMDDEPRAYSHCRVRAIGRISFVERFDADALAELAVTLGARYVIFTTKHHEGFCLFDSQLTDYTSVKRGPKRDIVAEVLRPAANGVAHRLIFHVERWHHQPDATDALEDPAAHAQFIAYVHGQIRELMSRYGHIDVMWYDGWWPFDAPGWRADAMNAMVRELQPHILFNNRNCLPGDFATPEQHMTAVPGRVWEANLTLNDNWSYHPFDQNWKSPQQVMQLLLQAARNCGNLVLNVGPRGDGSIPEQYAAVFGQIGAWLRRNEASIFDTDVSAMDWVHYGAWTVKGHPRFSTCCAGRRRSPSPGSIAERSRRASSRTARPSPSRRPATS